MTTDDTPSETSPLLPQTTSVLPEPADASNGPLPNGTSQNGQTETNGKHVDEERVQDDDERRERQYQGLPEVKKQLKFIVPAVAIGVRDDFP